MAKRKRRSADSDPLYSRRSPRPKVPARTPRTRSRGGWVAPLQGAQFVGLAAGVGYGANGSGGGYSDGYEGGGGDAGGGDGGGGV